MVRIKQHFNICGTKSFFGRVGGGHFRYEQFWALFTPPKSYVTTPENGFQFFCAKISSFLRIFGTLTRKFVQHEVY